VNRRAFPEHAPNSAVRDAIVAAAATAAALFAAAGCNRATVLNPSPADSLREENLALREQVQQLTRKVSELEATLDRRRMLSDAGAGAPGDSGASAAAESGSGAAAVDPAVETATPRVTSVQIEGASEIVQEGVGPDAPLKLRLWVLPRDGRGRFLQIVGRLTVSVASVRAGTEPVEVATARFDPQQIRDAWRSGFMGTHYAFELPLAVPPELRSTPLTVTIRFDDAQTGRSFEDQRRLAPASRSNAQETQTRS